MVARRRRKKNKLRGNRFHGKGNTKNRRGGGRRGGRGRAGSHKHKYASYWMTFGVKKRLKPKERKGIAMALDALNAMVPKWLQEKKAAMEGKSVLLDGKALGLRKVLSNGSIQTPVILKNAQASEKARKKIESAGGKVLELGES